MDMERLYAITLLLVLATCKYVRSLYTRNELEKCGKVHSPNFNPDLAECETVKSR